MFTGRSARIVAATVSAVALNICLAFAGLSQTASADIANSEGDTTPEEIIVHGKTNIIILRNAVYRAEENFFDLFNALNSDDAFDIECERHRTTEQRRMGNRRCSPSFALEYEAWVTQKFLMSGGWGMGAAFANHEYLGLVREKQREMEAEMARLIEANPAFLDKIDDLERANDALDAEKERRGPCKKIFCRDRN